MSEKYNINNIQLQVRFPKKDDLSVKCHKDNPKVKAATSTLSISAQRENRQKICYSCPLPSRSTNPRS